MKRGVLLRAEAKKSAAKRRLALGAAQKQPEPFPPSTEPSPAPLDLEGLDNHLEKAPYDNLPEEEKGSVQSNNQQLSISPAYTHIIDKSRYQVPIADGIGVITIPQPLPDDETPCQWIVNGSTKLKVLNAPGHPARIPKPCRPDLFLIKSIPEMGLGLFAKHNIKCGDVFLTERPLLVSPRALRLTPQDITLHHYTPQQLQQIAMLEFESHIEYAIARLPSECEADYRALHNAHTTDGSGPLLGILRSNGYSIDNLYDGPTKTDDVGRYTAICKVGSRINHSCTSNVSYDFKLDSFSVQFFALRDIKAGEQFFYSYCSQETSRAERQAALAPYGFICNCRACVNATPETDKLRTTFGSQITAISKMMVENPSRFNEAAIQGALRLEKAMVREGLDTRLEFVGLLVSISLAYRRLGRVKESERYRVLMKALGKNLKNDE